MNRDSLRKLIQQSKDDPELLEAIQDALLSFEEYHRAIYSMEIRKQLLTDAADPREYREEVSKMDHNRTTNHNTVLANVKMLNRMVELSGLPPIYDGIVSEDRPYRRQVADSVLEFVQNIILERP
ncbi:MAG: DUF3232 domain-containing protein [Clostridia bacterium]|nr:DUF3232 domain-containing protein [Clostridia bacterium]